MAALVLIAAVLVANLVWTAASLAVFRLVGARVVDVRFGPLPIAITRTIAGVKLQLTPWPTASIGVLGRSPDDRDDSPRSWRRLGLARRLAALVVPWAIVFGVAIAALGASHAITSFAHGVRQMLLVLDLTPLARAFLHAAAAAPFAITLGVVCAKAAAANVLPWIGSGGFGVIAELARSIRRDPDAKARGAIVVALALYLFVLVRIAYALLRAWIG